MTMNIRVSVQDRIKMIESTLADAKTGTPSSRVTYSARIIEKMAPQKVALPISKAANSQRQDRALELEGLRTLGRVKKLLIQSGLPNSSPTLGKPLPMADVKAQVNDIAKQRPVAKPRPSLQKAAAQKTLSARPPVPAPRLLLAKAAAQPVPATGRQQVSERMPPLEEWDPSTVKKSTKSVISTDPKVIASAARWAAVGKVINQGVKD